MLKADLSSDTSGYVTISKEDVRFQSYLDGSFSRTEVALPVESVNLDSPRERVTFQLVDLNFIERPGLLKLFLSLIRVEWLTLSVSPFLATVALALGQGLELNYLSTFQALVSVLFLQASAFLYNDYSDYVHGADRVREKNDRDYIKKGWIKACHVRRLAMVSLVAGAMVGLPLLMEKTYWLLAVAVLAGLCILGYSRKSYGFKNLGLGGVVMLICFGPLLTAGTAEVSTVEGFGWREILLGALFGHLAMICLDLRQLSHLWYDGVVGVRTLAVRLGFDRAQTWSLTHLTLNGIFVLLVWWMLGAPFWSYALLLPYFYLWWEVFSRLRRLKSPLSSDIAALPYWASQLHLILGLSMCLMGIMAWILK